MDRGKVPSGSQGNISKRLDAFTCDVFGDAYDTLAEEGELTLTLYLEGEDGARDARMFINDSPDQCLEAAHNAVKRAKSEGVGENGSEPVRYAIAYVGMVAGKASSYDEALVVEFGEKGSKQGYSGYSTFKNAGKPKDFVWTEPASAGIGEILL